MSLLAQERRFQPIFDASYRCAPSPTCAAPEEHTTPIIRPPAPSVSLYRLSHKVPGKARKAWKRAASSAAAGRAQEAVAFLDEALAHDGNFADALHMRGLFAYQSRDFQRAASMLIHAARLDDANPAFLADAALGQLVIRNPVEAERYARAALRLNPEQPRALKVLNNLRP